MKLDLSEYEPLKINLVASTNNINTKEQALKFARDCARVCYSEKEFSKILKEKSGKTLEKILSDGHHSPFDHINFTLEFINLPKMGAIILNNERPNVTSEKSARYTRMKPNPEQKKLYDKWISIFNNKISSKYPKLPTDKIEKLSQENARYLTSIFTPTHMLHTISFRQLNYLVHWFDNFISTYGYENKLTSGISNFMKDFNNIIKKDLNLFESRLDPKLKNRHLRLIANKTSFKEHFDETYCTIYKASLAQLAQAHRHRTIGYEILPINSNEFFVPPILENEQDIKEWKRDRSSIKDDVLQGDLFFIHEYGYYKNFLSKLTERACEHAQWEIMNQTLKTFNKYMGEIKESNLLLYEEFITYSRGPKCTFPGIRCIEPGPFGFKLALTRIV